MPHRAVFAAFALVACLAPARAADLDQGEKLARRWCAACHLVSADQKRATPDVPSFAAIARREDAPPLEKFLAVSHPQMPDMSLSRDEIADIAAYIRAKAP